MPKLTTTQIAKLAARRKVIDDQIKELTKEKDGISAKLLALDPSTDVEGEGIHLTFSPYRQLDTEYVERRFPPTKYPELYDLKLSTTEFKKSVSANDLEQYQKITYRINIKEV